MNLKSIFTVLLLLGFANILKAEESTDNECNSGHWMCLKNRKCIAMSWRCDSDPDCGDDDHSDEENCPPKTCADGEFSCPSNGQCIAERWKCDGEPDCEPNGEDEDPKLCANSSSSCASDEMACSDRSCISLNWVCDGVQDCPDGLDEVNCTKTCGGDMFTCSDGQCISHSWVCDGDHDCLDKSDENGCPEKECEDDKFKCSDSSRCIDIKWKCDGDFDCPDHSDETNCSSSVEEQCSPTTDFQCKTSGECIHQAWYCDGDPDCTDLSDEHQDCNYTCPTNKFLCGNNYCISQSLVCDGNEDCTDGSDEKNCAKTCAGDRVFDCSGDGTTCIPNSEVCDGRNDCPHREDEDPVMCKEKFPCLYHECPNNSYCERTPLSNKTMIAKCVCNRGFEWNEDSGHCKDIDECQNPGTCSQICINTHGGYKCECQPGYTLEKHYFCRANGDPGWLYYANRQDIRRLRTDSLFAEVVVEETENSIALDFDFEQGVMFWTDVGLGKIMRADVGGMAVLVTDIKTVLHNDGKEAFSPDGLAVDWIYKHIYWTDTGSNKIKVANYDGTKVKTLIDMGLDDPRAICVDPENGYVYWTDWGRDPKIERSGMDGNHRETIVHGGEHLEWPNGLTIDYIGKRIYWIDSKLHKIGTAKLDGSDKGHVLVDATEVRRPFSITVFEDSLYWTDWSTNSIKTVHKVTGRDRKTLSIGSYAVMDIKVYHELRQERGFKDEANALCKSADCEFMCLPAARRDINATVTCVCADNQVLNSDNRTCSAAPITKAPPTTPKPATDKPEPVTTVKPASTERPITHAPEHSTLSPGGKNVTEGVPANKESKGVGSIAIIAACVATLLIAIVFAVGCFIFRKYRSKNKKSMNFDNPVYRKTTTSDDHCIIHNDEPQMEPLTGGDETV